MATNAPLLISRVRGQPPEFRQPEATSAAASPPTREVEPAVAMEVKAPTVAMPEPEPPQQTKEAEVAMPLPEAEETSQVQINEPSEVKLTPPKGMAATDDAMMETTSSVDENGTIVISSTTSVPHKRSREFIPEMLTAQAPAQQVSYAAPGSMIERPLSPLERNVVHCFEVLSRLLDEGLTTPRAFFRHRSPNVGALLPFTHDPAAAGLERPSASADASVARLQALRRALEIRAISPDQHASERAMILAALLPPSPYERAKPMHLPTDVIHGAAIVSRLEMLEKRGLITPEELDREGKAINQYLRTGSFETTATSVQFQTDSEAEMKTSRSGKDEADKKTTAENKSADGKSHVLIRPTNLPVLYLASFRSSTAADRAWNDMLGRNKELLGAYRQIVRKVDLGEGKGIFYCLMVGSFKTLPDAENICVKLKLRNSFCRATIDRS